MHSQSHKTTTSILAENTPESLVDICAEFCVRNLETFCDYDDSIQRYALREGVSIPNEICERLFEKRRDFLKIDDDFLSIFCDPRQTRLRRINLSKCSEITDAAIETLAKHNLLALDISHCRNLTKMSLTLLNEHCTDLLSLVIGDSIQILPGILTLDVENESDEIELFNHLPPQSDYILNMPSLRQLVIHETDEPMKSEYRFLLFRNLTNLTHVDLSECSALEDLAYLVHLKHLVSLVLFDVPRLQCAVMNICKITTLRHLDISQNGIRFEKYTSPAKMLEHIVLSLPALSSLDISGTNLAEAETFSHSSKLRKLSDASAVQDIPGLRSRVSCPFDFLGLLNTSNDACQRHNIPAKKIAGDANEEQILTAAHAYMDRPEVLKKVLNDLFKIFRYATCHNYQLALKLILQAMKLHILEKNIQIVGSASLYYIIKGDKDKGSSLNVKVRQNVVRILLNTMYEHKNDPAMMRNGCITLCNFQIPQDMLFDYSRLVGIVLHFLSVEDQDSFLQRIGVFLLNSLACQVDGDQKRLVGELGAITTMLNLIKCRLERMECDDVMEFAWSTMWNVTDETPVNCKLFLKGNGMKYFLDCLETFPDKAELLRNMMGLLGNVAEVDHLRASLMMSKYIKVFSDLLENNSEGIEISYNAAGVLAHILADGETFWTITSPSRQEVLRKMVWAIEKWDLHTKRNINYRSFQPIFRLLKVTHTPEAQHWATWALANLTRVYPEKYCPLVKGEGGLEILAELIKDEQPYWRIKELAQLVITHCERFEKFGNLDGLLDLDDTEMA